MAKPFLPPAKAIFRAIIHGERPSGSRLVTSRLAVQLGVSPTPIREALVELELAGFVELSHQRGAVVLPFGRAELRELYHVRRLLEAEAARLACGRIDTASIQNLRSALERLLHPGIENEVSWFHEVAVLDSSVHQIVVGYCGNRRLAGEVGRYHDFGATMRDLIGTGRDRHEPCLAVFFDLFQALDASQPEKASAAMARHISLAAEVAEKVMFDGHG